MAAQGFAYVPWVNPVDGLAFPEGTPSQGTIEYAQTYGFGIVSNPLRDELNRQDPAADPNESYKTGLASSMRYAYNLALSGKNVADIEKGIEEGSPLSKYGPPPSDDGGGCRGEANRIVYPENEDVQVVRDLYGAAKLALANIQSDARVATAEHEWSDCMIGLGHPRFARRVDVFNTFMSETPNLDKLDTAAVAAFKSREIKAAVDDLTCADRVGYTTTYDRLRDEVERKFIADHQAELDAYVAKRGNR